jgi:prevent-host-death family protein
VDHHCVPRRVRRRSTPTYGYDRRMSEVASRELRNDTAGVLRRVQAGEEVMVTVSGKPVAQLVPLQQTRRHSGA